METRCLLRVLTYEQPCSSSIFVTPSWSLPLRNPSSLHYQRPRIPSYIRHEFTVARSRRWDSNAENVRTRRFNFEFNNKDEEDEEEDDDVSFGMDENTNVLEEIMDNVFILKVFQSFGWMLPAIILSLLSATGPKAFLLALAIPLGQSAISLALKKFVGMQNSSKRKSTRKGKPFSRAASGTKMGEKQEASPGTNKGKTRYQSWVAGNTSSEEKGGQDAANFGGWDELDDRRGYNTGSTQKTAQTTSGRRRVSVESGRLSRGGKESKTPLFLRLLIAVFPFLGSWTRLF